MKPNTRSASGALLMLVVIPVIVGLLACMPVPIGDPERSRIDPDFNGVWTALEDGGALLVDGDAPGFYAFEPYDKRTWLLTELPLEEGSEADLSQYDLSSYAGLAMLMENEPVGDEGATTTEVRLYKVWRTKIGGEWFMTWEPKGFFGEDDFQPDAWFVFRIEKMDQNTIDLYMVEGSDSFFKDVKKTRRAYERVIRKNVKNAALYSDEPARLVRLTPEHRSFFERLAGEVMVDW